MLIKDLFSQQQTKSTILRRAEQIDQSILAQAFRGELKKVVNNSGLLGLQKWRKYANMLISVI